MGQCQSGFIPKKRKVAELEAQELGAHINGTVQTIGGSPERLVKLVQATLFLLSRPHLSKKLTQIVAGRWIHVFQFRRPAMSFLESTWEFIAKKGLNLHLVNRVRRELFNCMCSVPFLHTFLGASVAGVTTASDASNSGGAVGIAKSLTAAGQDYVTTLANFPRPRRVPVLVISLFNGIGGALRAYDVLSVVPVGAVVFEIHPPANRVTMKRWPYAEICGDVRSLDEVMIRNWLDKYIPLGRFSLQWPVIGQGWTSRASRTWFRPLLGGGKNQTAFGERTATSRGPQIRGGERGLHGQGALWRDLQWAGSQTLSPQPFRRRANAEAQALLDIRGDRGCRGGDHLWRENTLDRDHSNSPISHHGPVGYRGLRMAWRRGRTPPTNCDEVHQAKKTARIPGRFEPLRLGYNIYRWTSDDFRFPPYHYQQRFIFWRGNNWRLCNASEKDLLLGYGWEHTKLCYNASTIKGNPQQHEDERLSLLGEFQCFLFRDPCCSTVPSLYPQTSLSPTGVAHGTCTWVYMSFESGCTIGA